MANCLGLVLTLGYYGYHSNDWLTHQSNLRFQYFEELIVHWKFNYVGNVSTILFIRQIQIVVFNVKSLKLLLNFPITLLQSKASFTNANSQIFGVIMNKFLQLLFRVKKICVWFTVVKVMKTLGPGQISFFVFLCLFYLVSVWQFDHIVH